MKGRKNGNNGITKYCPSCDAWKLLKTFSKDKSRWDGLRNTCKICEREKRKKRISTPSQKERHNMAVYNYRKRYYLKYKAHNWTAGALRLGHITKPINCSMCGMETKIEAHHSDYTKPWEIDWVCKNCHMDIHYYKEKIA